VHNLLNVHGQTVADLRHVVEGELGMYRGMGIRDTHRFKDASQGESRLRGK
jgi:hypothetical protein